MRTIAKIMLFFALGALALDFLQQDPDKGFALRTLGEVWRKTDYYSWLAYEETPRAALWKGLVDPMLNQPPATLLFLGLAASVFAFVQLSRLSHGRA